MSSQIPFNLEQSGGRPCARVLRIRVKDLGELLTTGVSETEILGDFPYFEHDDIMACLECAAEEFDHPVLIAR
jgi:uncharacterized protein (DUF433 family)